jgi:hypothetical protein
MPSPFPGVDPYLEAHWRDVHTRLIVYVSDQIHEQLRAPLRARVEERLVVESPEEDDRETYPDARVFESRPSSRLGTPLVGVTGMIEPLVLPAPSEAPTERFIEITDHSDGERLVTVIELMSPSNKRRGASGQLYRRKQQEVKDAGVNLVEIDLTRGGHRRFIVPPREVPRSHRTTFGACVYRARGKRSTFELYPIPLDRPVPPIRIPLRPVDADVILDLQPLLARAYANGGYEDIDYTRPPHPPLSDADTAWAERLLAR